jgi:hypothetical protein
MPQGQENIPRRLDQLLPQGTFFTQVVNRGILAHYVATASLATGDCARFNNFAALPPENPTAFEYFRKDLKRPAIDAWVAAPRNGFTRIGESSNRSYAPGLGAGVILPKRLLTAALACGVGAPYEHLLRDNYETPLYTPELSGSEFELRQLEEILKLSVTDFTGHVRNLASPDELSVYVAQQLMRQFAPSLLWITLHDIDIAYSGAYSLCIEGIRRSDRLSAEIWKAIQSDPDYAGRITMFILPDFGRDSDADAGGNGFQHHRAGDPLSRMTWILVIGPGVRENVIVDRAVESIDLVPTLGSLLGFAPRKAQGKPLAEVIQQDMLSSELKPEQFRAYPPKARQLAIDHLASLQQLPACFAALLLREIVAYDWKFPAEQRGLKQQFACLDSLAPEQRQKAMAGFARVRLSAQLESFDWVSEPVQYSEQLTAHLWVIHQIDGFRAAALDFGRQVNSTGIPELPPIPRLGIVVIGQGVTANKCPLFRKFRKRGVCFTGIRPENGVRTLLDAVASRATAHPVPFGHWYIDGGAKAPVSCPELTSTSYHSLEPQRAGLPKKMEKVILSGAGGPEALRTLMAQLRPEEIGLSGAADEAVLNHFQVSVLTEGSGTQIFSETFVQWAAREALRRAQPVRLLARFAPRQRERPMNELIASAQRGPALDPGGSLIDADMGAYLTWLNQQRLSGAEQSPFLAWWQDRREALAIGPALPRGTESSSPLDIRQLLSQIT